MLELIKKNPVVAILRGMPNEKALSYASAVAEGGVRAFEVALNTPGALNQIELLRSRFGDEVEIGAGTALTPELARDALHAGASFLLSPSADTAVLDYCAQNNVRLLPGVMTPSDVSKCLRYGFFVLKLFPAGDLPIGYIKSLKGPFNNTEYVAVGGVNAKNISSFFAAGFLGAGIGGGLVPAGILNEQRWDAVTEHVRALLHQVEVGRQSKR